MMHDLRVVHHRVWRFVEFGTVAAEAPVRARRSAVEAGVLELVE